MNETPGHLQVHSLVAVYVSYAEAHVVLSRRIADFFLLAESMERLFSNAFRNLAHYLSHRVIPASQCLRLQNVHDSLDGVYD